MGVLLAQNMAHLNSDPMSIDLRVVRSYLREDLGQVTWPSQGPFLAKETHGTEDAKEHGQSMR